MDARFTLVALLGTGGLIALVSATAAQSSCTTTLDCAQQAVAAAAQTEAAINKMQATQVGVMSCNKTFNTAGGEPQLKVDFSQADCQNASPKKGNGWTYVPVLSGTTICGGFAEYVISPDPSNPYIQFFSNSASGFCKGVGAQVSVNWIGFNPSAF
jgi:hypothetical protein